jgi:hypothetical protein
MMTRGVGGGGGTQASGADGLPGHTSAMDAVEAVLVAELRYPSPIAGSLPFPSGQGRWLTVGGGRMQGWVLPSPPGEQLRLRCLDRMPERSRLDGGGSWFEYLVARSIAYREARRRPGGARVATWAPSTAPRNWHGDYCGRPTATWRQGGGGSDVTDERRPPPNPPTDPNQEFRRALERETDLSLREDPERRRMYTSMDLPRSRSPSDEGSPPTRRHHRHDELTWNGEKLTLVGWSQRTGIRVEVLLRRCRRGWSVEEVLTTPLGEDRPGPYSSS